MIAITGFIEDIGKDFMDDSYINLKVDFLKSVHCYFSNKSNKIISQIRKGHKVTVIGKCGGKILTDVVIKDCELRE